MHQIRKLADLGKPEQPKPKWMQHMAKRRRKTLVVCDTCHASIHNPQRRSDGVGGIVAGEPGELKGSRRVRERGGAGG